MDDQRDYAEEAANQALMEESDDPEKSDENFDRFFITTNGFNWTLWYVTEMPEMFNEAEFAKKYPHCHYTPAKDGTTLLITASLHLTRDKVYRELYDYLSMLPVKSERWSTHYLPDLNEKVVYATFDNG